MMLVPCTADDIMLGEKIQDNILRLQKMHMRICGMDLQIPADMELDYRRFLTVRKRHYTGDMRWSDEEKSAVRSVADWTLWVLYALQEQAIANDGKGAKWTSTATPPKPIDWRN